MGAMELGPSSILVDVGAGIGRPLLHAMLAHGVRDASGIEYDPHTADAAAHFGKAVQREFEKKGGVGTIALPSIVCGDAAKMGALEPCTHVYACWQGFSPADKAEVARLFNRSRTARCIAVVEPSKRDVEGFMASLGFEGISLTQTIPGVMCGITTLTAYVFFKVNRRGC
jgi:hypothetical protein